MGVGSWLKSGIEGGFRGILGGANEIVQSLTVDPSEKLQAQLKLKDLEIQAMNSAREFAIEYEGSAKDVPVWVRVMRSMIRPVVTVSLFFSYLFFLGSDILTGTDWLNKLPTQYYGILYIVLGFWFGGKIGENIVDKVKKKS